jgi:hypothetical protein
MNVTDTASAASSLLMDLQVGGASKFAVKKNGLLTAQTLTIGLGGQTSVASNTALGYQALNSASLVGINNVGVGYQALLSTTSGESNSAFGFKALTSNTTGLYNSAIGYQPLYNNTSGNGNNAIGLNALFNNTTGGNNSAIGWASLVLNTTGSNNIAIGFQAGDSITTGDNNIVIGYNVDADSATESNQINIGGVYFHDRLLYTERADPAAPAANQAVVYARDNGSGKTQLCVRFATGSVQVLATEP